jgi:hypothetical protein
MRWAEQMQPRSGQDWYIGGYLSKLRDSPRSTGLRGTEKEWWLMGYDDATGDIERRS